MNSLVLNLLVGSGAGTEATIDLADGSLPLLRLAEAEPAAGGGEEDGLFSFDLVAAAFPFALPALGVGLIGAFLAAELDLEVEAFGVGACTGAGAGESSSSSNSSWLSSTSTSLLPALLPLVFKNLRRLARGMSSCSETSQAMTSGKEALELFRPRMARSCIGLKRF